MITFSRGYGGEGLGINTRTQKITEQKRLPKGVFQVKGLGAVTPMLSNLKNVGCVGCTGAKVKEQAATKSNTAGGCSQTAVGVGVVGPGQVVCECRCELGGAHAELTRRCQNQVHRQLVGLWGCLHCVITPHWTFTSNKQLYFLPARHAVLLCGL